MTAYLLCKAAIEAGFPKGVLNIIHGYGPSAGQAIVANTKIKAISFTGGTHTVKKIIETAGPMFKKLSLELGGKNPNIIFADSDFDKMIAEAKPNTVIVTTKDSTHDDYIWTPDP